ncbi:MAG: SH3 domain-containing protein [Candidatus Promineifilaceae bacterium]
MAGITIPLILALAAVVAALMAYQGVRRGGARFYTLERESMLRRASFTLLGSVILFLAAVGLLVYSYRQVAPPDEGTAGTGTPGAQATDEGGLETQPPTGTPPPTVDPNAPTPTLTPVICRAVIEGTGASGLTLRDAPSGAEIGVLSEGTIVTVLPEEPVEASGFVWRAVRTTAQEEGWLAADFLTMGECG